MRIWTFSEPGSEKVIAAGGDFICRGNPKPADMDDALKELASGSVPRKDFFSIKLHMLKQVNLEEGKPYLDLRFGQGSYEHFRVKDPAVRQEIFDHLKGSLIPFQYALDKFSPVRAAKSQINGALVALGICIWSLHVADLMESGGRNETMNGPYDIFSGMALVIGGLGTGNVLAIFGVIFAILGFVIIDKVKHPPVVHRLTRTN